MTRANMIGRRDINNRLHLIMHRTIGPMGYIGPLVHSSVTLIACYSNNPLPKSPI